MLYAATQDRCSVPFLLWKRLSAFLSSSGSKLWQGLFDSLYRRFLHELVEVGAVGKDGVVVHIIYESIVVAFVLALDSLVENGQLFRLQFLGESGQDGFGYGTVYFVVVVFVVDVVEHLFQLCFGSSKQRVVFSLSAPSLSYA